MTTRLRGFLRIGVSVTVIRSGRELRETKLVQTHGSGDPECLKALVLTAWAQVEYYQ